MFRLGLFHDYLRYFNACFYDIPTLRHYRLNVAACACIDYGSVRLHDDGLRSCSVNHNLAVEGCNRHIVAVNSLNACLSCHYFVAGHRLAFVVCHGDIYLFSPSGAAVATNWVPETGCSVIF